jgi:hypothetical protein
MALKVLNVVEDHPLIVPVLLWHAQFLTVDSLY